VGQGGEGKVEVVFYPRVFESGRLRDGRPELAEVLQEGVLEVAQGSVANVVADDEEEQGSWGGPR
jgi:hypothetical protein